MQAVLDYVLISTHTLTWSVTYASYVHCVTPKDFNSHAHVERDLFSPSFVSSFRDFNSHAHVERDKDTFITTIDVQRFQLTRSRGA